MSAQCEHVYFDGQWLYRDMLYTVIDQNVSFFLKLLIRFGSCCEKTFKLYSISVYIYIYIYMCVLKHNLSRLSLLTSTHTTCKKSWLIDVYVVSSQHRHCRLHGCMQSNDCDEHTRREKKEKRERNYKWTLKSISLSLSLSLLVAQLPMRIRERYWLYLLQCRVTTAKETDWNWCV